MSTLDVSNLALVDYYGRPAVRARIREYCGLEAGAPASCIFIVAEFPGERRPPGWSLNPQYPAGRLDDLLDRGADVFRSMWDRRALPVCFDIDYLNAELPGHAFARPGEVFARVEPTYVAVRGLLQEYGLGMLALMTGRGYQFTGRMPLDSALVDHLAALAPRVPDWYGSQSTRLPTWVGDRVTERHARAYVGLGLVLEYFAHRVIRRAAGTSAIPLVLNGTTVGYGRHGREAVSLDLSFAGDPLDARHMRAAFAGYQQHRLRPDIYGAEVSALDPLVTVPRGDRPLGDMLTSHRRTEGAARLAQTCSASIPIVTDGVSALTAEYRQSPLARFHESFYADEPHGPAAWPDTYDRFEVSSVPPCVAAPIAAPNDALLKPEHLQHVTRFLFSDGWAPRHIAGLVWSRYARDCGWGERWQHLSPLARAEFDVRVFAGMIVTGLDQGLDFNCKSAQEKQLCPWSGCPHDLRVTRDRLLRRAV